ncbi:MAG: crotonobetainyl-CoA:carnitine CoA-transferase CaiB-like acyl-CoA transferase, partial [Candidatus Azotimanducaceae bacterium]
DSKTLKNRESIVQIDDRLGGTRPTFQSPYRFSGAKSGVSKGAPRQGEHNFEVLSTWLQYSENRIETLIQGGTLLSNA